ncbi:MAG: NTP/NDP exchange transporter [Rickettsiales bacterium]|nr:MAG: NTP/NDP exchange transporter [Rickettsiales bacterium]
MSNNQINQFKSNFRNIFWPIHNSELSKFIPISALMFCVIFNQNILRILKDSILISEVSAEVTSFSKVYVVAPMAAMFVISYAKLINHLPIHKIFYYLAAIFTSFYILFAFIIYPNIDLYHMDREVLQELMIKYPHFKWYIAAVGNWSYIIFYSLSELWPNVFYVLMFWQIANEVTKTDEAKRFYTLFSLFGNSSLILVGFLMMYLSSDNSVINKLFTVSDSKILLTQVSISLAVLSTILSCLLVRYIAKNLIKDPLELNNSAIAKLKRPKMGIVESFKYITRSKYLWLMLICSASFGLSMNLVEAVWKAKIKELYPTVNSFAEFNSLYILWTGVAIMVMTIIGNNVMRRSNWFVAAVISPLIILITGTLFFILVVFDDYIMSYLDGIIIMSPLALAVFVGAVQNILSKGSKYSILDTSSQMLYIPLDQELRTKGKAAVDVISPKIGKSTSGLLQSLIFTIVPTATYSSISFGLMIIFIVVCVLWIYAVRKVYFEYQKIV